jgi:endonuclease G, mitochondrial
MGCIERVMFASLGHGYAVRSCLEVPEMADLSAKTVSAYRGKMADLAPVVSRNRRLIQEKRWQEIETDDDRSRNYEARRASKLKAGGAEALQGDTNDLQAVSFIVEGAHRRRAVAFVEAISPNSVTVGTGFLISPRLFITNQHVLGDAAAASTANLTFDREYDERGRPVKVTVFAVDGSKFALFSPEEDLDYALVAVGERINGEATLEELGYCALSDRPDKHRLGMAVNVIQHPGGMPKMVAVRNNILHDRTDNALLYETDTQTGSSGAPVFNDDWDVVALHHYGEPFRALKDETGRTIPISMNEGIRISAIFKDLKTRLGSLAGEQRDMLSEALALDDANMELSHPRLGGPRGAIKSALPEALSIPHGTNLEEMDMSINEDGVVRISVPLEISVRLGTRTNAASAIVAVPPQKLLARASEKLKLDRDYANRNGYDPDFVSGVSLPLPTLGSDIKKAVAALRAGEQNAASGVLKYQNFSVIMNKSTRLAIFTATNIDGETYLAVDRNTGQVTGVAEGESWFKDTRISESFTLNQDFYSEWSTYFDRGHLTRRTDPTWGSEEQAERANADTFHFSNCSPQHFRFNQTTKFWQGAERYVLEKGALSTKEGRRINVFQGPIFDNSIDRFAGDQQIPSSFFKIIVWRGKEGLKSVGLVVDQIALLDEERRGLSRPSDKALIDVNQWRVAIETIEKRIGLDFGKEVRKADTISSTKQPKVGERMLRLTSLEGILG